jgi:hypothetical protein
LFDNSVNTQDPYLQRAIDAEIEHLRALSSTKDLLLASSNRGAYEALLHIIRAGKVGMPVYEAVSCVGSAPSSHSGILLRLRSMRAAGIIDDVPGNKRSNVNLRASDEIVAALAPILMRWSAN